MIEIASVNDSRLSCGGNVCLIVSAPWCGTCRMMKPSFEKMATAVDNVLFLSADADKIPDVATKYGIKSLPTAILLKDGEVIKSLHGAEIKDRTIRDSF